jgi:hypothetical protein
VPQKISISSAATAPSAGVRHMYTVVQFRAVRSLDIPPALGRGMVGGSQFSQKSLPEAPYQASEGVLRQRCDARGFKPLPIEIIARRKVASAFEPQNLSWVDGPARPTSETGAPGRACKVLFGNLVVKVRHLVAVSHHDETTGFNPSRPLPRD